MSLRDGVLPSKQTPYNMGLIHRKSTPALVYGAKESAPRNDMLIKKTLKVLETFRVFGLKIYLLFLRKVGTSRSSVLMLGCDEDLDSEDDL